MRPVGAGVVDGALQVLELVGVDDERLEVVVAVRVVHGALQRPKFGNRVVEKVSCATDTHHCSAET